MFSAAVYLYRKQRKRDNKPFVSIWTRCPPCLRSCLPSKEFRHLFCESARPPASSGLRLTVLKLIFQTARARRSALRACPVRKVQRRLWPARLTS